MRTAEPPDQTSERWDEEYDLVVLGAGAGGMTAALVGALEGMRVLLVEKTDQAGGTTAFSSGSVWIPGNPQQEGIGIRGDAEAARQYLDALVDGLAEPALREAFLSAGPEMLRYLEQRAGVRFTVYPRHPDYRQELPGAAQGGRPLEPLPFDGRTLGKHFNRVRAPLPELTLWGGMMVTRAEIALLLRIPWSWDAIGLGAKLTTRYARDRLRRKRGTRLVLGNALAARLFKSLLDRDVPVWFNARTRNLITPGKGVAGLVIDHDGAHARVRARLGVVLAGGGFPASAAMRERFLPKPVAQYTAACDGCTGDTLDLAQRAGAALGAPGQDNALWFPCSVARRKDGSTAVYPHIVLDRAKPGLIAVNAAGNRFVDEAVSYHEFTRAMYRSNESVPSIPATLICDRRFLWKYGLGMVRPRTLRLKPFTTSGYLYVADSLEELASRAGVAPGGLRETVARHNEFARTAVDADFGKGSNSYDCGNGDPKHLPNPCLGLIERPPYYAVAVVPAPLGTSLGLRTDAHARVLSQTGCAIEGLYACGNDMHSIMGGEYPGAGAQLGVAMTFGYVAALHAASPERAEGR